LRYETTRKDVDEKIILKRTFNRTGESELDFTVRVEESGAALVIPVVSFWVLKGW
jgi:hypothetical protein